MFGTFLGDHLLTSAGGYSPASIIIGIVVAVFAIPFLLDFIIGGKP